MNPMKLAIDEAWKYQGLTYPNPAVGATVLKDGLICSIESHKKAGMPHAEVNAIKEAFLKLSQNKNANNKLASLEDSNDIHHFLEKNHNNVFNGCEINVTLEPCSHFGKTPPCANLISSLGFKKVVIGAKDFNTKAAGGADFLKNNGIAVEYSEYQNECNALLFPFKKWLTSRFVFFKLATTLNGGTLGNITGSEAKIKVHELRSVVDILITGGQTIRLDKPILDARLINSRAPNLGIYSKQKEFDRGIACFDVLDRDILVSDSLDALFGNNKFIMIEGGINLFKAVKDKCDAMLLFQNRSYSMDSCAFEHIFGRLANVEQLGNDSKSWFFNK